MTKNRGVHKHDMAIKMRRVEVFTLGDLSLDGELAVLNENS